MYNETSILRDLTEIESFEDIKPKISFKRKTIPKIVFNINIGGYIFVIDFGGKKFDFNIIGMLYCLRNDKLTPSENSKLLKFLIERMLSESSKELNNNPKITINRRLIHKEIERIFLITVNHKNHSIS